MLWMLLQWLHTKIPAINKILIDSGKRIKRGRYHRPLFLYLNKLNIQYLSKSYNEKKHIQEFFGQFYADSCVFIIL